MQALGRGEQEPQTPTVPQVCGASRGEKWRSDRVQFVSGKGLSGICWEQLGSSLQEAVVLGQEGGGPGSCVEGGPWAGGGGMWAGEGVLAGHHRRGPVSTGPQGSVRRGDEGRAGATPQGHGCGMAGAGREPGGQVMRALMPGLVEREHGSESASGAGGGGGRPS